jgi:serine/threonine-protein kinase
MLSACGVKVVDFGIAGNSGQHQVDGDGVVFGTRAYMAPEQVTDAPVAPAGDVYALGVLLHECLTAARYGQVAESAPTVAGPAASGRGSVPPLPPGVPATVSTLVTACLSSDPELRPTSAEVAETLHRAVGETAWSQPTIRAGVPMNDMSTVAQDASVDDDLPGRRSLLHRLRSGQAPRRRSVSLPQAALAAASAAILTIAVALQLPGSASSDGTPTVLPAPDSPNGQAATDCMTRYSAKYRPDGTFTAVLDLTYTGVESLPAWSVRFALPAGQRLVGADHGRWIQTAGTVTITTDQPLFPGQTVSLGLHGKASNHGDPPRGFALDGHTCSRSATDLEATRSVTVPGPTRTVREPQGRPDDPGRRPPATPPREPTPTRPTPTDPTPTQPTPSQPTPTRPTPTQPTPTDPTPTDPASSQPDPSQPDPSQPDPSRADGPPRSGTAHPLRS